MTQEEIREVLIEKGLEETVLFSAPDYCEAYIGVSDEGRAVYDYDKMVLSLMMNDKMSFEDAVEFIDYNTIRALPYVKNGPIVLYPHEQLEDIDSEETK